MLANVKDMCAMLSVPSIGAKSFPNPFTFVEYISDTAFSHVRDQTDNEKGIKYHVSDSIFFRYANLENILGVFWAQEVENAVSMRLAWYHAELFSLVRQIRFTE